jgi:hypothetical protein
LALPCKESSNEYLKYLISLKESDKAVLLVEGIRENNRSAASHWQTLSDNVVSSTPHHEQGSNSQL